MCRTRSALVARIEQLATPNDAASVTPLFRRKSELLDGSSHSPEGRYAAKAQFTDVLAQTLPPGSLREHSRSSFSGVQKRFKDLIRHLAQCRARFGDGVAKFFD